MFNVGDIITGTPENDYGITTRGMVCEVIGTEDCEPGDINVKIIDVDEYLIKESRSGFVRNTTNLASYIGCKYTVSEEQFEYYELKAKLADLSDDLIDFIDSM